MKFDLYILGMILSGLSSAFFGCLVFLNNRNKTGLVFLIFSFSFSLWTLPYAIWLAQPDAADALFWSRMLNLGATFIPIFYIHWVVLSLKKGFEHRILLLVGYTATIIYSLFSFSPIYINEVAVVSQFPFWPQANLVYILFLFTLLLPFFGYGIYLLVCTFISNTEGSISRIQSKYMLIGSIMSTIGGVSNFPLMFGIPFFAPQLTLLTIFHPMFWAYGSLQHKIFNMKTVATEIFVFSIWIFILVRTIMIPVTTDQLTEGILLLITMVFGIFLIQSVNKEVKQRGRAERLATDLKNLNSTLSQKVAEQTTEIRHSYEAEKRARQELEKLNDAKDQFIMITQHSLRTPVTGIAYGLESILSGSYGAIASGARKVMQDMKASANRLTRIVDDFLNITTLKIGRSILNISSVSLKPAIVDILHDFNDDIARRNLEVSYPDNDTDWPKLSIDFDKMREILFVVIENAVRYNSDGGSISISTNIQSDTFELIIENTGLGITSEEKEKIGSALFYRGQYARKAYPTGMGIGLSVVKAVVTAHHGSFNIESKGHGHGAKVTMRIPLETGL